ncbi:MAG: hypothetical protein KAI24_15605 [Planctomycetes bacterium]|nr:hypothetical protein [Planctomycetota bacterium]
MNKRPLSCCVGSLLLTGSAAVAQVSTDLVLATPVVVEAGSGGTVTSQTLAAGLSGPHAVGTFYQGTDMQSVCLDGESIYRSGATWRLTARVGAPTEFARMARAEVLLSLQAPVATPVSIELSRGLVQLFPTQVPPSFTQDYSIDVGDDGIVELSNQTASPVVLPAVVGPTPTMVRLVAEIDLAAVGDLELELLVDVLPANDLSIHAITPPCAGDQIVVGPTFLDRGIDVITLSPRPLVAVFGTTFQPLNLPFGSGSCVLLPSPDVIVFVPLGAPVQVALPPAVRPFALWVQGVALHPGGLATSNGTLVVGL